MKIKFKMNLFIFRDDKLCYVDMDVIREMYRKGSLKNARVLGKLLNLEKSDKIDLKMRKENTEKGEVFTLFKDLDILLYEWNVLLYFLKKGKLINENRKNLEILLDVGNKLGGIEIVDDYIEICIDNGFGKRVKIEDSDSEGYPVNLYNKNQ